MTARLVLALLLCLPVVLPTAGCDGVRALSASGDVVPYLEWIKYETRTDPQPSVAVVLAAWGEPAHVDRRDGRVLRLEYWFRGIDGDLRYGTLTFDDDGLLIAKDIT